VSTMMNTLYFYKQWSWRPYNGGFLVYLFLSPF
jgi:hypothetical protein